MGDHDTIKNSDDLAEIPSTKNRLTMLGYNHSLPCEIGSIILTEISTPVPERAQSNHNNANARKCIISFQLHTKKSNNEVTFPTFGRNFICLQFSCFLSAGDNRQRLRPLTRRVGHVSLHKCLRSQLIICL